MLKKLLFVLVLLPSIAFGQSNIPQGGTGWSTSTPGDLLVGTSSIRYSRLPIGSSGTVLQASSTSPFRMAWVTLSSIFDSLLSSNNTWTGTNDFTATTTLGVVNITGNLAVDTNTLYVDSTNNRVGIGTTSPANKLHVYEATAATPVRLSLNNAVTGATANDGLALAVDEVGDAFVIQREAANLKLYTNNTVTNGILINSSGNVGIGTSSPVYKLDVAGGDVKIGNAYYLRSATAAGTNFRMFGVNSSNVQYIGGIDTGVVATLYSTAPTNVYHAFYTQGAEVGRFHQTGLSVATSSSPAILTVASSTLTGTSPVFMVATTTPIIVAQANGRVGIGSNVGTPTAPLHVFTPVSNSTTVTGQYIINSGSGAGAGAKLLMGYNTTSAASGGIGSYYSTSHFNGTVGVKTDIEAGGTTFLTGSVTGDVGIGTSTPYARLAVQGQSGSSTPVFIVASSTGSTPYFQVTAAGNIGVSSAAPPARLYLNQLSGGVTGGFLVGQGDSATNYAAALYRESSVNYGVLGLFDGNTTARVSLRGGVGADSYFNSGGDLGVGTTTPTSLLTVASSTQSTSYSIFGVFNALANPIMNILGSGAVLFGTTTQATCGSTTCGVTIATTTQVTQGSFAVPEYRWGTGTSTSMTVDWTRANTQNIILGTSAVTITFSNATTTTGQVQKLVICNPPSGTAGTITWGTAITWSAGTAPTQTTTANKCDVWSFISTNATGTARIFGSQSSNF